MLDKTQKQINYAKTYAQKEWGYTLNPSIKEVSRLTQVDFFNPENKDDFIFFSDDFKLPIATRGFLFSFTGKDRIGYEAKNDFTFNTWVKIKKGDFVYIDLGMNRFISDFTLVVNGKEHGISSSIINYDNSSIDILELGENTLLEFLSELNSEFQ